MTEEEMEAQDARVQPLVQRLENRSYKEEMLENTKQTIKGLRSDIRFIGHVLNCNECIMEASIDVERYWGGHGGMAWLDLNNNLEDLVEYNRYDAFEDFENPVDEEILRLWKEIPRVAAYRIGSYWSGTSPDTIRFIKDRLMWAEKLVRIELKKAKRYLRQLKMWNLNGPPPPEYWRTI
jgi:hypothetical protein